MHHPSSRGRGQAPQSPRKCRPRNPPDHGCRDVESEPGALEHSFPPIAPTDLPLDIMLARLRGVSGYGPSWYACCPAHTDLRPSLSITETDEHVLLIYCHAGCTAEAIMAAIGLDLSFLFPSAFALRAGKRKGRTTAGLPRLRRDLPVVEPAIDHARYEDILRECLAPERRLKELARHLGLPLPSIRALKVGYHERRDCWAFPERDGEGRVVGIVYRPREGERTCEPGSKRGLTIPSDHERLGMGPVYLPEGASDVAALHSVGALAIGRPAARASLLAQQWLTRLLREYGGRDLIVLGERDKKEDGRWPGRDGARELALYLRVALDRPVSSALPARHFKDVREQIISGEWAKGLSIKESR